MTPQSAAITIGELFRGYQGLRGSYDELFDDKAAPRHGRALEFLMGLSPSELSRCQALAEISLANQGVTFSVNADARGAERVFPFCLIPRVVSSADWTALERGLIQRITALGHFLDDIYGEQRIFKPGQSAIPADLVLGAKHYLSVLRGVKPPGGVRITISGVDVIRDTEGVFRVLEDNLRTPSGVSYVVENRAVSKRVLPQAFARARVRRVDHYPQRLADTLRKAAPVGTSTPDPFVVVLTPGPFNSAYYEHSFLAGAMGAELVQAGDLFVDGNVVYARTTRGPRRVDVIYRRTDEAFLDPEVFRPDSMLGVRGLMRAYTAGNVTLCNAPGNGVADDKAVYPFVPEMIRYYLGEEPLLAQVPTYVCLRDDDRKYVLDHLDKLVVKAVDEAGGYGMLMGPQASKEEREEFRRRITAEPRRYIAQPRIELSTCPAFEASLKTVGARRVDLRPYILTDRDGSWVLPGGLTRVALVEGSYVVNSSQGGGSKDTWVLK